MELKRQRSPSKRIANRLLTVSSLNMKKPVLSHEYNTQDANAYENAFGELCSWLRKELERDGIIAMRDIKSYFEDILCRRNASLSSYGLLGSSIRARLKSKFRDDLIFYRRSKYEGLYVVLNDLPLILDKSINMAFPEKKKPPDACDKMGAERLEHKQCESLFDTVQLLRASIQKHSHFFTMLQKNRSSLTEFDSQMFWNCLPVLLKNFIGMLTLSERRLNEMKKNYDFYSCWYLVSSFFSWKSYSVVVLVLTNDMFINNDKKLKIASISYDIINATNDRFITPKHYLLANELFRHERSAQLLTITNRFGHTCSYRTMTRLQCEIAEKVKISSNILEHVERRSTGEHKHEFAVKIADNFDMNKETLRGENSIHMLNRIIVKTPEYSR